MSHQHKPRKHSRHLRCKACGIAPIDVRVRERRLPPAADINGNWVATVCIGCGRWFGYRPVDQEIAKKKKRTRK